MRRTGILAWISPKVEPFRHEAVTLARTMSPEGFEYTWKQTNPHLMMKITACLMGSLITMVPAVLADVPAASENPVVVESARLLPADLLVGPSFRVRSLAVTDGYLAHFEVDTDFGTFNAVGLSGVRARVVEAEALRKLAETSKSDLFQEGLKRSVEQPVEAVKNIVKHPVDSVKQAPATVGHFFIKAGSAVGRGVTTLAARTKEDVEDADTDAAEATANFGKGLGRAARNAAGFEKARLDTARQLGVDPYSDNPLLQEEMDKVTWAFFAGGLPLRLGAVVVSAGTVVVATKMVGIPEDTYAMTKAELALKDEAALQAMGVSLEDIKDFQIQRFLGVTRRHRIVNSLEAMPKAGGRGNIVRLANSCSSPEQADFLVSALSMLAGRQASGGSDYKAVKVIGRLPAGETTAGELQVPAPVDFVTWTEDVRAFAARDDLGPGPKSVIHTGTLSQDATAGFLAAGWRIVKVSYP